MPERHPGRLLRRPDADDRVRHPSRDRAASSSRAISTRAAPGRGRPYDGESGMIIFAGSTARNNPVEVVESRIPTIRILRYGLRPDSGGAGRHRGGLGIERLYEFLAPAFITFSLERKVTPPWGLRGGQDGAVNGVEITAPDGAVRHVRKATQHPIAAGERVRIMTGGGGGFGPAGRARRGGGAARRPRGLRDAPRPRGATTARAAGPSRAARWPRSARSAAARCSTAPARRPSAPRSSWWTGADHRGRPRRHHAGARGRRGARLERPLRDARAWSTRTATSRSCRATATRSASSARRRCPRPCARRRTSAATSPRGPPRCG